MSIVLTITNRSKMERRYWTKDETGRMRPVFGVAKYATIAGYDYIAFPVIFYEEGEFYNVWQGEIENNIMDVLTIVRMSLVAITSARQPLTPQEVEELYRDGKQDDVEIAYADLTEYINIPRGQVHIFRFKLNFT